MIRRRFSFWQKVVALAPLLLLGVNLPGEWALRCRMDGSLRPACCCAGEDAPAPVAPALRAQDCCDREVTPALQLVAAAVGPSDHEVGRTLGIAGLAPPLGGLPLLPVPARVRLSKDGPPRDGPPAVLLKHAFLI